MSNKNKGFNIFVLIFVVITGAGFGSLTGIGYSEHYWWGGMIAGIVSSYFLAKLYLKLLAKTSSRGHKKVAVWFSGTLVAITCGIICTTLVHGIMTLIIVYNSNEPLMSEMDGFWSLVVIVGELVGFAAGLVVGGICSLVYVLKIMDKKDEADKLA
jgi:hypothetical protein